MSEQLKAIQKVLNQKAEKKNKEFFSGVVQGKQKIYGVKTPDLNILASQYKSGSFELASELWKAGALEEKVIAIKIMEKTGKQDPKRLLRLFSKFSTRIDNWAVCDGLGMQFLRGIVKTHAADIFSLANKYNRSPNFWLRRLSLVMVEWYTRDGSYRKEIMQLVKNLEDDDAYYVKKAVIWIKRNFTKEK